MLCNHCKIELPADRYEIQMKKNKAGKWVAYVRKHCRSCVEEKRQLRKHEKLLKQAMEELEKSDELKLYEQNLLSKNI